MHVASRSLSRVVLFGAVACALVGNGSRARASPPRERIDCLSQRSFDETVDQLQWGFGGYGMTLVAQMDFQSFVQDPEAHPRRSRSLAVMKRSWIETILEHAPEAALDLPVRIQVYEREDGRVVVSYYRPAALFGAYDEPALKALGRSIESSLQSIIRVATRSI